MSLVETELKCFHCGDPCEGIPLTKENNNFCCQGCLSVYELLHSSGMDNFYSMEKNPGTKIKDATSYAYLDDPEIEKKLFLFADEKTAHVKIHLPTIHCNSCIWLLENLTKLNKQIISCHVNFLKKEATIIFDRNLKFSELAALLHKIGYSPNFSLENLSKKERKTDKSLMYKIGIAGFCFGNIMLLSLPYYLGADLIEDIYYMRLFGFIQIALALPIVLYVSTDYFRSAYYSIKTKTISIDIPLSFGIIILFSRSLYEIISATGAGYLDSLAGLLFFMMIGKWFQKNTYENLVFDRDYKSYFPISVNKWINEEEKPTPLEKIKEGDILLIRHGELIPCDAILISENASLDYSFVTGETDHIHKSKNDHLYSGAKLNGQLIKIKVTKAVDQSYLTQLWNKDVFKKTNENDLENILNKASKYFTLAILFITTFAAVYWYINDSTKIWKIIAEILIITCPCAFALSSPFTLGNIIRFFGKNKIYMKDAHSVEKMASVKELVFDKTGTITYLNRKNIKWKGEVLSIDEKEAIHALSNNSMHPFSRSISNYLSSFKFNEGISDYQEITGKGVQGYYKNKLVKIGSADFVDSSHKNFNSTVFVSINNEIKGYFDFEQLFRNDISSTLNTLGKSYRLHLLSGDKPSHQELIFQNFPNENIHFSQSPIDKLNYIENLQNKNIKVAMIGDGLNDAGALAASEFGITITDDITTFTPSSDAILESSSLNKLPQLFQLAKEGITIIKLSFLLSFIYNMIGITFAISGALTPLFAAILMPLSSITIIVFVTWAVNFRGNKILKSAQNH